MEVLRKIASPLSEVQRCELLIRLRLFVYKPQNMTDEGVEVSQILLNDIINGGVAYVPVKMNHL